MLIIDFVHDSFGTVLFNSILKDAFGAFSIWIWIFESISVPAPKRGLPIVDSEGGLGLVDGKSGGCGGR